MANLLVSFVNPLLYTLLKFYGLRAQKVEIEPGTVILFWVPIIKTNHKQKPALVLLHGFAGTGVLTWLFQVVAFARNYPVYVPDLLFFGGSTTDRTERTPEFQGERLAKGLKLLGVESCVVVGCSYGGIVGSKMAELDPELVKCLVLSNSNLGFPESASKRALETVGTNFSLVELFLPQTVEGLKILLSSVVHKTPWFPNWAYKHYLEVMFDHRKERSELLKALVIKDVDYVIPNYSQKIYILAGEKDNYFNLESLQRTKSQLGEKASLHSIKNAGHLAHLERPFAYNRCLNKILASL
ncbi:hypothetical protein UlMin_032747 [Ulmus minor]